MWWVGYSVECLAKNHHSIGAKNTCIHGCRRRLFSRLPDFSLKKNKLFLTKEMQNIRSNSFTLKPKVSSNLQWFINSIFTDFYPKGQFLQALNKLPWHLHDLEEFFPGPCPDLWQPCGVCIQVIAQLMHDPNIFGNFWGHQIDSTPKNLQSFINQGYYTLICHVLMFFFYLRQNPRIVTSY